MIVAGHHMLGADIHVGKYGYAFIGLKKLAGIVINAVCKQA